MLKDSLIICYSTPNYKPVTDILFQSLIEINISNICHLLDKPEENILKKTGFQTDLWYYSVTNKIKHLNFALYNINNYKYKYFIFCDCDVWFLKNNIYEWNNLQKYIDSNNKDIYFMRENTSSDLNSGFFIIKNNTNIKNIRLFFIEVYSIMLSEKKDRMPLGDQTIINRLKHKINFGYIPNDYVIFGTNIFNKKKSLFHHAVWCIDIEDKIKQINLIKSQFN
jgi:hypothetical protein